MSNRERILIVEDEPNITGFLSTILSANDYEVLKAENGKQALMLITSHCPDAVILDLGLPDIDGQSVIKSVREWSSVPIVVVSARTHERDKVAALDLGADDYVTKPFSSGELLARVRTALRHAKHRESVAGMDEEAFHTGALTVDFGKRRVFLDNADVHLTQIEYRILELLARYACRVLTYDFIIKRVWGPNASFDNQILRVNMANIRRKIEENPAEPKYLFTEVGVGYRLAEGD